MQAFKDQISANTPKELSPLMVHGHFKSPEVPVRKSIQEAATNLSSSVSGLN